MSGAPLLCVRDLNVRFDTAQGAVQAVNGVSFEVQPGEVLGLIGESGCGKSVSLRALMRLLPANRARISGTVTVAGQDVLALNERALGDYRGGTTAMIFQDPGLTLDPVYTIGQQIGEAIQRHSGCASATARAQALQWLEQVKLPSPRARLDNYPHELSGGMRQRAMIALALSCNPKLVLADEPTTALDATVQMQVLLVLRELQQRLGMGAVFVTHDLGVAAEICDRIAVMYAGRIVEIGRAEDVLLQPQHPYTQALLAATLHGSMRGTRRVGLAGSPPDLLALPTGCAFAERCVHASAACAQGVPVLTPSSATASAACWQLTQRNPGRPYRIALLNPNTSAASTALMMTSALSACPPHVHIEGRNVHFGQAFIANPAALAEAALAVEACGPGLAEEGFDAIVVAGFGDPGVASLRKRLAIPVIGLGEAGIAAAAQGGLRYAIVTVTPALHDSLLASAQAAAPIAQLAGIRYTDGALDAVMHNPLSLEAALLQACQTAIRQDGAQAIVMGGGPLAQAAQDIAGKLHIRIVDPVCAAIRQACLLGGISNPVLPT